MGKIRRKEESLTSEEKDEKQYQLALEANPADADAHYNYGNLLEQLERYVEAEKQYQLAIELDNREQKK